jgi:hypothetical protein
MANIYVARKRLKMGDNVWREPGDEVPEACDWRNLHSYLSSGALVLVQTDVEHEYGMKQRIPVAPGLHDYRIPVLQPTHRDQLAGWGEPEPEVPYALDDWGTPSLIFVSGTAGDDRTYPITVGGTGLTQADHWGYAIAPAYVGEPSSFTPIVPDLITDTEGEFSIPVAASINVGGQQPGIYIVGFDAQDTVLGSPDWPNWGGQTILDGMNGTPAPVSVDGGTEVTMGSRQGTNYSGITGLSVNGVAVDTWSWDDTNSVLLITAPANPAGVYDLLFTNGGPYAGPHPGPAMVPSAFDYS